MRDPPALVGREELDIRFEESLHAQGGVRDVVESSLVARPTDEGGGESWRNINITACASILVQVWGVFYLSVRSFVATH